MSSSTASVGSAAIIPGVAKKASNKMTADEFAAALKAIDGPIPQKPKFRCKYRDFDRIADQRRMRRFQPVDPGTTLDDVLDPAAWADHFRDLAPFDIIEVRAIDFSFAADLLVTRVTNGGAVVVPLFSWTNEQNAVRPLTFREHKGQIVPRIEWAGPSHKWRVIGFDGEPALDRGGKALVGFVTKEEAEAELTAFCIRLGIKPGA